MNVTRCLHLAALVALATGMAGAAGSPGSAATGPDDPPHAYRQPAGPSDLLGSFGRRIGDLDPHFGLVPSMPGRFTVDFGGTSPSAEFPIGVLMLPGDGFIVVGISTVFEPDDGARLVLSWHRRDGHYAPRLDQGREIIPLGNLPFEEFELLRAQGVFDPSAGITQPRVYAAGRATSGPGNSDFLVICVTYMTGSFIRCPGFGSNGMATVPFDLGGEPYRHDRAGDLHIDVARQRLLLAGSAQFDRHDHDFAIASLDMNSGAPDPTFGNQGRKTIPFDVGGLHGDHAHSILVHMDGRISVGGSASDGVHPRAAMAQLLPDGSLDTGFCPTAEPTCDSPLPYRNGRRLWNDEPQGASTRIVRLLGGSFHTSGGVAVVRHQEFPGPGRDVWTGQGLVSLQRGDGGCSPCTVALLQEGDGLRIEDAVLDARLVLAGDLLLPDFGVLVTATGLVPGTLNAVTHVYRVKMTMQLDTAFSSGPAPARQVFDYPSSIKGYRESWPQVITRDSRNRILVAGSRVWDEADTDITLTRLQYDVILENGFD